MTMTEAAPTVRYSESDADGATITGDLRPYGEVRDALKAAGWRWSKFQRCWYYPRSNADPAKRAAAYAIIETIAQLGVSVETDAGTAEASNDAQRCTSAPKGIDLENLVIPLEDSYSGRGWVGVRRRELHQGGSGYLPLTTINEHLRTDLRTAQRAGQLPKTARFSVSKAARGNSITVTVTGAAESRERRQTIGAIVTRYNMNDSMPETDYFDVGFYTDIKFR